MVTKVRPCARAHSHGARMTRETPFTVCTSSAMSSSLASPLRPLRSPRHGSATPESRRPAATHAVGPADVHLGPAGGTLQLLPRRRLAAVGAEIHLAVAGEHAAAIGALPPGRVLVLRKLERSLGGMRGRRGGGRRGSPLMLRLLSLRWR